MASDKLVVAPPVSVGLTRQEMEHEAEQMLKSGYFPHIKSPAQAVTVALRARDLGLPISFGFEKMCVVKGHVVTAVEIMTAKALASKAITWDILKNDDTEAVVEFTRWDNPYRPEWKYVSRYTIQDAERMGKNKPKHTSTWGGEKKEIDDDQYVKQPRNMLLVRALGQGLRILASDIINGLYAFEEMGVMPDPHDSTRPYIVDGEVQMEQGVGAVELADEYVEVEETETEACVTDADVQEFRQWGKELCKEQGITSKQLTELVDGFLCEFGRPLDKLTPQELTVLYQNLKDFDYSTVGE